MSTKNATSSMTIWGLLSMILGTWGVPEVDPTLTNVQLGLQLLGLILAFVGRWRKGDLRLPFIGKTAALLAAGLSLLACATTGASDQLAGQAPVRGTSATWNAVATTEARGTLRDTLGLASEGVEVPLLTKDGAPIFDASGNPVTIKVGRGVRDVNFFFGETTISAETTVSGSSSGNPQTNTPAPRGPDIPVNVSGIPK